MPVDNKLFHRIFQGNVDGQKILDELSRLFYDRGSYVEGDPHGTTFKEGQRSGVAFIIRKCAVKEEEDKSIDLDKE